MCILKRSWFQHLFIIHFCRISYFFSGFCFIKFFIKFVLFNCHLNSEENNQLGRWPALGTTSTKLVLCTPVPSLSTWSRYFKGIFRLVAPLSHVLVGFHNATLMAIVNQGISTTNINHNPCKGLTILGDSFCFPLLQTI